MLYHEALGVASANDAQRLTTLHAFDIGSLSKQFTAAAIVRLVERGKLRLDDPAAKHLPGLPYPQVTISQLLTHTAGTPDLMQHYSRLLRSGQVRSPIVGDDAVDLLAQQNAPLRFDPGARFEYSNTGYLLLALVVTKVSGKEFAQFLEHEFFKPLGMRHTHLRWPDQEPAISPRAYGLLVNPDGSKRAMDQLPNFYAMGAGGIYSTTGDLHAWMTALRQGKVMNDSSWRAATTPVRLSDGPSVPYGFGWSLRPSRRGQPRINHGGHWRAFKAELAMLPTQGIEIVMLSNNGEDDSVEQVLDAAESILAGSQVSMMKESIHWELHERLKKDDPATLKQWLLAEFSDVSPRRDFPEDKINNIGYQLLRAGEHDKALVVMEFNRDAHPTSLNALDSAADAYLAKGNRAAALAQVRRMLELKPDSPRIREKLRSLQDAQ